MKPRPYFVEYWATDLVDAQRARVGDDFDPADVTRIENFTNIDDARKFFNVCAKKKEGPRLFKRVSLVDATPAGDPPGLLWDYVTELIAD